MRSQTVSKIFNTDQGLQFNSTALTGPLLTLGISMDGKAAWRDNVLFERISKRVNTRKFV